jgi:hypothetical protein
MLVVEPDYLPDSEVLFQPCLDPIWTPLPDGGCGGDFPPTSLARGVQGGGGRNFGAPPPWRGFKGKHPRREIFGKIAL